MHVKLKVKQGEERNTTHFLRRVILYLQTGPAQPRPPTSRASSHDTNGNLTSQQLII